MTKLNSGRSQETIWRSPVDAWMGRLVSSLMFIFPFSFALDFKGESGGTLAQVLMALMAAMLFTAILVTGELHPSRWEKRLIIYTLLILSIGSVVAILNGVPWDIYGRVFLPFALFFAGLWTGIVAANSRVHASPLLSGMVAASLISVCFRYIYATEMSGISLLDMRYQVLSPTICTLIAYACATFSFMRRVNFSVLFAAAASTGSILISVTRGYVFTFVFAAAGLSILLWRLSRCNPQHQRFILWRQIGLGIALVGLVVGLGVSYILRPDIIDQWSGRLLTNRVLTQSGEDVNLVSRIAEAKGIWEGVDSTFGGFVWGKGFGNIYYWSYDYAGEVGSVSMEMVNAMFAPTWWAGHSPFTYALFFGGVPALIWQICVYFVPLYVGWKRAADHRQIVDSKILVLFVFNVLSVLLYLSQSFASNPFGERMSAQFLGFSVGMLLASNKLIRESCTSAQSRTCHQPQHSQVSR